MAGLAGRIGVVTGAASGLGRAIAEQFAACGGAVIVADLDGDGANGVCAGIVARGGAAIPAIADVADAPSVEELADLCFGRFGRCDMLINNAGIADFGPALDMPLSWWRRILDVNLMGIVHGVAAFAPRMAMAEGPAHIVNIASMAGLVPLPGFGAYTASKCAVVGLSEVLHQELAPSGIAVSIACPGWIATGIQSSGGSDDGPVFKPELCRVLSPETAARIILEQALAGRSHIFTHPEWDGEVRARSDRIMRAMSADSGV
ncbi:SDR family NAD(P)-dependent oxidoreductase [Sphingomonas colocasiae]|uniref:SDR family NAD(P)-dependent oxidoreductase n=1 Tax=Sphingomonas colocasiae TaxID=1848973 RepID=A0ABS7PSC3_9SPHN|nr:SDR family NAD(P)-dependent oxidoreductase [Sphingomonas colocasiae]MBY8823575.1 SDR family NAD(P)-dependent oxidoreductase [Sphingomonas colocasiae]